MIKENYVKYMLDSIRSHWDSNAFTDYEGETMKYKDVGKRILQLHCNFDNFGIKKGDKIALIGKNSAAWSVVYLAVSTYGAVIVPLLVDFKSKEIHHLINHSESVLLYAFDSSINQIDFDQVPHLQGVVSLDDFSVKFDRKGNLGKAIDKTHKNFEKKFGDKLKPENFVLPEIKNDEMLEILYTSGTSGFSKGVMLNHNSIANNIKFARKNLDLTRTDRVLSFLPLAHAYGCAFELLYPFTMGAHITYLGKMPAPNVLLAAFEKLKPRIVFSVPLIIEKIYRKKIKPVLDKPVIKALLKVPLLREQLYAKIRKQLSTAFGGSFYEIVIGGAALNKEVETFLQLIKFKYAVGYGMTECGPLISYADYKYQKLFSCGQQIGGMEVKIDSHHPTKEPGEILTRGENIMLGYYKNELATRDAIDPDGWLHTGDLGIMDKDGHIYIKGRSKSMILGPSGQNIYPEEIETKIDSLPFVQESLVIEAEGKLCALIFPDKEAAAKANLNTEALKAEFETHRKQLNKELPNYMAISRVELVDKEFEKTPKKSIKRFLYTTPNFMVHTIEND